MNSDDLYQDVLLQHSRRPKNQGLIENPTHRADGYNALCGDEISVELQIDENRINAIKFQSSACAICTASASIMTGEVEGQSVDSALSMASGFRTLAKDGTVSPAVQGHSILEVMGSIHRFPQRVKCAILPWETLVAAIDHPTEPPPASDTSVG